MSAEVVWIAKPPVNTSLRCALTSKKRFVEVSEGHFNNAELVVTTQPPYLARFGRGQRVCLLPSVDGEAHSELGALQDRYADLWRFYVFVPTEAVGRTTSIASETFHIPCEAHRHVAQAQRSRDLVDRTCTAPPPK